jgi:Ca2+-binding RTX toxin-like protein
MATKRGTNGRDTLIGDGTADVLIGKGGSDILRGLGGDDVLRPGSGRDRMYGGSGDDLAILSELDSASPDLFDGGGGRDTLNARAARDDFFHLIAWSYDSATGVYSVRQFGDTVDKPDALTFTNVEVLIGADDDDQMLFNFTTDDLEIQGGAGHDRIDTGAGDDILRGGTGDDRLSGGDGRNLMYGGSGDDELSLGYRATGLLDGGIGSDTLRAGGDVDLAKGYAVNDVGQRIAIRNIENVDLSGFVDGVVVRGDGGRNVFNADFAFEGATFFGAGGRDSILGGDGADRIFGDAGNDVLEGGGGDDRLTGGTGADRFRFADNFFSDPLGTDRILDFSRAERDRIDLSGMDADTVTEGTQTFRFVGTAAFTGSAGELRYEVGRDTRIEADTNGDGAADLTILMDGPLALRAADFILVGGDPF